MWDGMSEGGGNHAGKILMGLYSYLIVVLICESGVNEGNLMMHIISPIICSSAESVGE